MVIDPGVGSSRRALAAAAGGHLFVAPDNGVLSQVFEQEPNRELRAIDLRHGLAPVSRTFHGRDLFAPVAARLASGMEFAQVGPPLDDAAMLPPSAPRNGAGRVLHVDGFGNVVTSFRRGDLPTGGGVRLGNLIVSEWADTYADAPGAAPFLIAGSSGYVEVSVNRGSAASLAGRARRRGGLRDLKRAVKDYFAADRSIFFPANSVEAMCIIGSPRPLPISESTSRSTEPMILTTVTSSGRWLLR